MRARRKVNIVSSRLKAFWSFADTFQNAIKSGWKITRSGWTAGSGVVTSGDSSTYPILSTKMVNTDITIAIQNPGIGTGAALWVTDSGEWYGVVTQQQLSVGTGNCASSNPINPCGYTNPINYCGYSNPVNPCAYTNPVYTVCNPVNPCAYTNPVVPGYCCNPVVPGNINPSDFCGATNPVSCNPVYYICYGYAPYNSYNCGRSGTQCGQCTTQYGPYGGNCSGGNCVRTGGNRNPSTGGNSNPDTGGNCVSTGGCGNAGGNCVSTGGCVATGGNCVATGGSCNSYNDTYPRYLKVIKYVSNAVTELFSQTIDQVTSYSTYAGLKVIVSNSSVSNQTATVTAKMYSDSSLITQIGPDMIFNATGVKINTNYGIIASPSSYNQGNSITSVTIS
jgi:hypothetical protein